MKRYYVFLITLLLGASIGVYHFQQRERGFERTGGEIKPDPQTEINMVALSYLSNPMFANSDFAEQITGTKVEHERLNLDEEMVYFSIDSDNYEESTLAKLSKRPEQAEFAKLEGDALKLGKYIYRGRGRYFFRIPMNDFWANPKSSIKIKFPATTYDLSVQELVEFAKDRSVYGGSPEFEKLDFFNHAPFVARREPSLTRFVSKIVKAGTQEQHAQQLLDFATRQLKYSGLETLIDLEVLKRANEVLMSGGSDCSGLVILYASLLEQIGTDYLLLYMGSRRDDSVNHIAVGVAGDFPNENEMSFTIAGKSYSIAEVTVPGFRIGQSQLVDFQGIEEIKYFQKPGQSIVHAKTGNVVQ